MLFYIQMRWNIEGRLPLDDMWELQVEEAAKAGAAVTNMYKVAAQRRVIAIGEFASADELDRTFMARLPLREYLELEAVWPLRKFTDFIADCRTGFATDG